MEYDTQYEYKDEYIHMLVYRQGNHVCTNDNMLFYKAKDRQDGELIISPEQYHRYGWNGYFDYEDFFDIYLKYNILIWRGRSFHYISSKPTSINKLQEYAVGFFESLTKALRSFYLPPLFLHTETCEEYVYSLFDVSRRYIVKEQRKVYIDGNITYAHQLKAYLIYLVGVHIVSVCQSKKIGPIRQLFEPRLLKCIYDYLVLPGYRKKYKPGHHTKY